MYIGLVYDNDWTVILQCLCSASCGWQGLAKYIFCMLSRTTLIKIVKFIEDTYLQYQEISQNYRDILTKSSKLILTLVKLNGFLYTITSLSVVMVPFIYQLIFGERILIMYFIIPGVDRYSTKGYIIHMVVQFVCVPFAAFGNFAGDLLFVILVLHVPMFKDIIKEKLSEIDQAPPKKRNKLLKNISEWHQRYDLFIEDIGEIYGPVIFVEISLGCIGVCCTLFSIALGWGVWPAGPVYLVFSLLLMYCYCGLGHKIEESNDELLLDIYMECRWYELTVQQQKMLLLMLIKAQSPVTLNVGKIMPLSISTALQLTKAIYSFLMMLINFLD
uniref:Odorant receptor n=1 Tax=Glossina brevipalpis TaxID=37001 RepID=A0A1A9X0V2_9MUSC